jgi:hypothetical protein
MVTGNIDDNPWTQVKLKVFPNIEAHAQNHPPTKNQIKRQLL